MALLLVLAVAGQFPELGRLDGTTGGIHAVVVLGLPVLALGVFAALYVRTRVEVRRRELDPPLYLLTLIGTTATGAPAAARTPTDEEDLELDRGRRREIAALRRRATRLLFAIGADAVVLWLAAAWYVREIRSIPTGVVTAQAFTAVERAPAAPRETLTSDLASSIPPGSDPEPPAAEPGLATPSAAPVRGPSRADPPGPSPVRERVRAVSPAPDRTSPTVPDRTPTDEKPPDADATRLDTGITASVVAAEVSAPILDSVRAVPAPPPAPDPAAVRAGAEFALGIGVRQVVRELNGRRPVPTAGAGEAAMARLADWIRDQRPTAAAGELADLVVDGPSGEAIVPVTLRWRDDFGVGKQRTIRLRIAVQREAENWVFTGAELLDRFP